MKKSLRVILAATVLGAASILGVPAAGADPAPPVPAVPELRRVLLHVEGMTCGGCALSTRLVLERLDGVERAEVDYERKRAAVTYDPAKTSPAAMVTALKEKLGYTATPLTKEAPE